MDKRELKIFFSKNSTGSKTAKTTLPTPFVKFLGLDEEKRNIIVELDKKQKAIVIKKKD